MSENPPMGDAVALIPAAGGGVRLGQGPKCFLRIGGRSLLQHVVELVRQRVGRILVGVPPDSMTLAEAELGNLAEVYAGGTTRLSTISALLARTSESLVVIHDAARPFASLDALTQVIEASRTHGAAVACRPLKVPIACVENGFSKSSIHPSRGVSFESPLSFQRAILDRALACAQESASSDEPLSDLALRTGASLKVVIDHECNFKITTPLDWEIAWRVVGPMMWPG